MSWVTETSAVRAEENNTILYLIHMLSSPHHDQCPQPICGDRGRRLLKCTWDNDKQKQKRDVGMNKKTDRKHDNHGKGWHKKRWMEDKQLHFYESVRECDWSNWLLVLQCAESPLWPVSVKSHSGDWCTLRQQRHYILKQEYLVLKRALHTSHNVCFIHGLSIFLYSWKPWFTNIPNKEC